MPSNLNKKFVQESLVAWFDKNQRVLPWRKTYDPYQVWISEIMLQQTQVKTALPYFERWIKKLPTLADLALADDETLLKLWEGLGYYSRARNLKKAALQIMSEHGGKLPSDPETLMKLSGIGRYSAGAIASIAFNQNAALVDGNVIRVLARFLRFTENTRAPKSVEYFWEKARALLPPGKARAFNQGLMELGALVCTPKSPRCGECPLKTKCLAFKKGEQEQWPDRGDSPGITALEVAVAVIQKDGKYFIQKRPEKGLMAGLWEFPGGKIEPGETPRQALAREIKEELGVTLTGIKPMMKIQHAYTRFRVQLHCFYANYGKGVIRLTAASKGKWVAVSNLRKFAFPAANKKIIERLSAIRPASRRSNASKN